MWIRRALFYWQFAAIIVLPAWILIMRGVLGSTVGWDFLLFAILCPVLGLVMLTVAGLTFARKRVRVTRTVSWVDAAVLVAWHAAIIAYGFIDSAPLAALVVALGIAAFWVAVWQLFSETRTRVRGVVADFEDAARIPASPQPPRETRVIILEPDETRARD